MGGSARPDCVAAQQAVRVKLYITSRELSFMTRKEKEKKFKQTKLTNEILAGIVLMLSKQPGLHPNLPHGSDFVLTNKPPNIQLFLRSHLP